MRRILFQIIILSLCIYLTGADSLAASDKVIDSLETAATEIVSVPENTDTLPPPDSVQASQSTDTLINKSSAQENNPPFDSSFIDVFPSYEGTQLRVYKSPPPADKNIKSSIYRLFSRKKKNIDAQPSGKRRHWRYFIPHFSVILIFGAFVFSILILFSRSREAGRFLTPARLSIMDKEVQKACTFIEEHFSDPGLSAENLCERLTTGNSFIQALFTKELGMSVEDFIVQVRVNRAKLHLKKSPSIDRSSLSLSVGYRSADDFEKVFLKISGISIGEYRSRMG